MKKFFCTLLCAALFTLSGCGKDIPPLEDFSFDTLPTLSGQLAGCTPDDLARAWGNPDGHLSGLWGDIWDVDTETGDYIIVYYDSEGIYDSSLYSHPATYTGTVTSIVPEEEESSVHTVTVEQDNGETVALMIEEPYPVPLSVGATATFRCRHSTGTERVWIDEINDIIMK